MFLQTYCQQFVGSCRYPVSSGFSPTVWPIILKSTLPHNPWPNPKMPRHVTPWLQFFSFKSQPSPEFPARTSSVLCSGVLDSCSSSSSVPNKDPCVFTSETGSVVSLGALQHGQNSYSKTSNITFNRRRECEYPLTVLIYNRNALLFFFHLRWCWLQVSCVLSLYVPMYPLYPHLLQDFYY